MEFRILPDKLFYILPFGIIFNMILGWEYTNYFTPDSFVYIEIAQELPTIKTTIFPLFYPFVLRLIQLFFHDYNFAVKFLNISLLIFIMLFVKRKEFYWKQIWMVFTFSSLQNIYPMIWSENMLLVLIILYSYYNHEFLTNQIKSNRFLMVCCLLLLLMFATKYNSIFFLVTNFIFAIYLVLTGKKEKAITYSIVTVISLLLFSSYLIFNYYVSESFTGKSGISPSFNYMEYFFASLKNIPLTYDPFAISLQKIAIKLKVLYNLYYITAIPYLISYVITFVAFLKFREIKNKKVDPFTIFFLLNSVVFLVFTFISSYFTKIDIIDSRLLIYFYIFLVLGAICFINYNKIFVNEKWFLYSGILSLILYLTNLIIVNFL